MEIVSFQCPSSEICQKNDMFKYSQAHIWQQWTEKQEVNQTSNLPEQSNHLKPFSHDVLIVGGITEISQKSFLRLCYFTSAFSFTSRQQIRANTETGQ